MTVETAPLITAGYGMLHDMLDKRTMYELDAPSPNSRQDSKKQMHSHVCLTELHGTIHANKCQGFNRVLMHACKFKMHPVRQQPFAHPDQPVHLGHEYGNRAILSWPGRNGESLLLHENWDSTGDAGFTPDSHGCNCPCNVTCLHVNTAPEPICHPMMEQAVFCESDAVLFHNTLYAMVIDHAK